MKGMGTDVREGLQYSTMQSLGIFSLRSPRLEFPEREWELVSSYFWQPGRLSSPEGGRVSLEAHLSLFWRSE